MNKKNRKSFIAMFLLFFILTCTFSLTPTISYADTTSTGFFNKVGTIIKDAFGFGDDRRTDQVKQDDKTSDQKDTDTKDRVGRVNKAMGRFMGEYKIHLTGFIGFGLMTSIVSFIYNFTQLGVYSSNPNKRGEVIHNLIISGVCTALLGGIGIITTLYYYTVLGVK